MYTQLRFSYKYSYNKIVTYFKDLISNRANFAVRCPASFENRYVMTMISLAFKQMIHLIFVNKLLIINKCNFYYQTHYDPPLSATEMR